MPRLTNTLYQSNKERESREDNDGAIYIYLSSLLSSQTVGLRPRHAFSFSFFSFMQNDEKRQTNNRSSTNEHTITAHIRFPPAVKFEKEKKDGHKMTTSMK